MSYAILRTKKLKSASQIARVGRHNEREQRTLNADPERTGLNVDYRPELTGSLVHRVRQRIGNRQHRTDAVLAVEVLMAYSPEAENKIDALSWGVASVDWLEKEIGRESIVSARLHQDEKTVHVACVFVPIDPAGRLNCKHYLGSPRKLAALQSRYAAAVSQFGLRRGEEGSKRTHVPIRDLYRDNNLLKQDADNAVAVIELLRDPPHVTMPVKGVFETHRDYEKRVNEVLREFLQRFWQQLEAAIATLMEAGRAVGLLKSEQTARIAATKKSRATEKRTAIADRGAAKAEAGLIKKRAKIAELEKLLADRCRELPLVQVARDLLKTDPTKTDGGVLFRTSRHRLLIRNDGFELADECSLGGVTKGKNSIDLISALMNCKFPRAVQYLSSRYDAEAVAATVVARAEERAVTLSRSPLTFSPEELRNALQRPETIRKPASPPLEIK